MKINNEQYGTLQSAVTISGTILPILGGMFVDAFGTVWGSVLSTGCIAIGTIMQAMSTNIDSFPLMIVGNFIYGIGGGTVMIVQEVMLTKWFTGRGLSLTLGCQISVGRLAAFFAMFTAVPLAKTTGFYGWAYWLSALLCLISFMFTLIYIYFLWKVRGNQLSEYAADISKKRSFKIDSLLRFPSSMWWLLALCLTLGGAWAVYLHIVTELISDRFGKSNTTAAMTTSLTQILPVFVAPFLGYILDRYKIHNIIMFSASLSYLISVVLLLFPDLQPFISTIIFSISLTIGPVAMMSIIPMSLPFSSVGTGTGIYKAGQNIGSTIMDVGLGRIQDISGNVNVIVTLIIVGILSVISSIGIYFTTHQTSLSDIHKYECEKINEPTLILKPKWWSWLWFTILCITLSTSIVVFLISLMTH